MICDALDEDDIYHAYRLYLSLHGIKLREEEIAERLAKYFNNEPDETIDDAIWAFAEDQVLAPPDVVLDRWGKSRVYELEEPSPGVYRHRVCESWFDNGCRFETDKVGFSLGHFWTKAWLAPELQQKLFTGMRFQMREAAGGGVQLMHREFGLAAVIAEPLASEISQRAGLNARYLPLFDSLVTDDEAANAKFFVAIASPEIEKDRFVDYAAHAFTAVRNKC